MLPNCFGCVVILSWTTKYLRGGAFIDNSLSLQVYFNSDICTLQDCFEDELVPLLESCGEIHDIRLMMVPHETDCNKGFAFVRMANRDAALKCVNKLDKYEIRPGKELGVCISESNCRLFIAGIPKDKTRTEILEVTSIE